MGGGACTSGASVATRKGGGRDSKKTELGDAKSNRLTRRVAGASVGLLEEIRSSRSHVRPFHD